MRRGIERVQLAKRIEYLRGQEDQEGDQADIPQDANQAAKEAFTVEGTEKGTATPPATPNMRPNMPSPAVSSGASSTGSRLSRAAKSDIFRAVVLAKTKEIQAQRHLEEMEQSAASKAGSKSSGPKKPSR